MSGRAPLPETITEDKRDGICNTKVNCIVMPTGQEA